MWALEDDEYALLELVKMKPLSYIPPLHLAKAEKLMREGILLWKDCQWYPTAVGMALAGANGAIKQSVN